MKVILHGLLAERFGREHEILTSIPAEAIEGISRQLPGWPRDLLIDAVGYPGMADLHAPTEDDELHLMPSMHGGGGVGKIIIGVALIAVAVFVPGLGTFLGTSVASLLFMAGAGLALSGVSELLFTAPKFDNGGQSADPPPSKYLGINKNTAAIGTLIIMAYGRILIAGHWLSLQSDSSDLVTASFPATTS